MTRLAAAQCRPTTWSTAADPFTDRFSFEIAVQVAQGRIDEHAAVVAEAGEAEADLVVTGEDVGGLYRAVGYLDNPSVFQGLAASSADYATEVFAALAGRYRMYVVACFFQPADGEIHNSAVLFDRAGNIAGTYHKVHLPGVETWLCAAGSSFPVFETDLGEVGMLICYDEVWPEAAAALALAGARIVCHPSAAVIADYRMRTRASDHQVFYVSGTEWHSRIVHPNGEILADAGDDRAAFIAADVDPSSASLPPEGFWDTLYSGVRDHRERHLKMRRPELYGIIADPHPPALDEYPSGGLANTRDAMEKAYLKQKEEFQRLLRGEEPRYHWRGHDKR